MIGPILLPFLAAIAAPWIHRGLRTWTGPVLALVPLAVTVRLAGFLPLRPDESLSLVLPWVPSLNVALAFRLDGLSAILALLVAAIGTAVVLYAGGYFGKDPRLGRFYAYLLAFMGAMLGLVLSDDLISMFVFWELTSLFSYLLIGFYHDKEESRDAALKALLITGTGGLALLAGLLLLSIAAMDLGVPAEEAGRFSAYTRVGLAQHPLAPAALILILVGALTKSAQFPFHFWLPAAMAGPTPVSAYLHSATMVKAGVYLLARLHPVLGEMALWHLLLTLTGATTMVLGAALAVTHRDLKAILAYSTLSVLGTLTMLLGAGTDLAVKAAVVYLVAHALYKAALFMAAGNVDHETGTRDVTRLGGLFTVMPVTAVAALIAAFSQAGAPPMFGFVGKELLYKAKLDLETLGRALILAAFVANVFLIAAALVVSTWPFFWKRHETPKKPHEAPWTMLIGPVALSGLGLFVGLLPGMFDKTLGSATASAIIGDSVEMKLKLWHGINPEAVTVLILSGVTLLAGLGLYIKLGAWLHRARLAATRIGRWGPTSVYPYLLPGLYRAAGVLTRHIQTGRLPSYLRVVVLVTMGIVAYPLIRSFAPNLDDNALRVHPHELLISILIAGGAVLALFLRNRLAAVASLGVTGFGIAVIFATFGAPDLALTQIMVEALTIILFVFVFYHLPETERPKTAAQRTVDGVVAIGAGTMMTLLVLVASSIHLDPTLSRYYAENSMPLAYGRNIVNVILVDFRALDTMGEITVVAVAGLGVYGLLRLRSNRTDRAENRPLESKEDESCPR